MEKQKVSSSQNDESNQFYRFQVFQTEHDLEGKFRKTKSVGMAYLKAGQKIFTLRLWTFLNERFYVIPNRNEPSRYFVMTREPNRNPMAKNKYFWNIVGSGLADSAKGVIQIGFDLFDKPIFMNIHPEPSAFSVHLPEPAFLDQAA